MNPALHILPFEPVGAAVAADAVARYACRLLATPMRISDPQINAERPLRAGDIVVLAFDTAHLSLLAERLALYGIAAVGGGAALFAIHPIVRQFLRGLGAVADRDDGVAQAALLGPPFFAVEPADLLAAVVVKDDSYPPRARVRAARDRVEALRRSRHLRSAGATARDLIEASGVGRVLATTFNGAATLAALYETAAFLDDHAARERLDFDALSDQCRIWAENATPLPLPASGGADGLRVMTAADAVDERFPVVLAWDGLGDAACVESAAVRARDLVVLPLRAGTHEPQAWPASIDSTRVERLAAFDPQTLPEWACDAQAVVPPCISADGSRQAFIDAERQAFMSALAAASVPVAVPALVAFEGATATNNDCDGLDLERTRKVEGSRFGATFGMTVRRAVQLVVGDLCGDAAIAVSRAATIEGPTPHQPEAVADVQRALQALAQLGAVADVKLARSFEVALAAWRSDGRLQQGVIDLLLPVGEDLLVVEIRSDKPTRGDLAKAFPRYAAQLTLYAELVRAAGLSNGRTVKLGVLLTASGEIRWM
jgi:ATP-dependent helicase/nuclease subunit A